MARSGRKPGARNSEATAMWRRPSWRNARTASPVAGGALEANAAVTGSLWWVPHSRASRATAWLASGSEEPAAASTSASSSRTLASLRASRRRRSSTSRKQVSRPRILVARIRSPSWRAVASAIAAGTSTFAWKASVSSSGTTTISSKPALTSRSTTVVNDGLDRSRNAGSMRRSGRIVRTSWTRALMDAAERGSRLPWARAISAGAAMEVSLPSVLWSGGLRRRCRRSGRRWPGSVR